MPRHRNRRLGEQGAALIWVFWILLALSALALAIQRLALTHAGSASVAVVRAQARGAAEAAIARTVETLLNQRGTRDPFTAIARTHEISEFSIGVEITPEAGRIDLNHADEMLLSASFAARGVDVRTALALAAAVVDWRDADELPRPDGAETLQYRRDGYAYGPRNGPFETVGELAMVKGMTATLFACIEPLFTVYSGVEMPDMRHATSGVAEIFTWAEREKWQERDWAARSGDSVINPALAAAGEVYRITATATGRSIEALTIEAVVRLASTSFQPFATLSWRELFDEGPPCGSATVGVALAVRGSGG